MLMRIKTNSRTNFLVGGGGCWGVHFSLFGVLIRLGVSIGVLGDGVKKTHFTVLLGGWISHAFHQIKSEIRALKPKTCTEPF